ncbi:MAG: enoyl-CoA hydratase [Chloroflexota bacterium]
MNDYKTLLLAQDDFVLTITLNRPHVRNAQNHTMLEELHAALLAAANDDTVRVIILAGAGDDFSSGHDLGSPEEKANADQPAAPTWEERYLLCRRLYLDYTKAWRDLPKPMIAQVQGHCIMGGLMLALACDFIICSDDARFTTRSVRWGASSEQYLALPWVIGVPQAKQALFTGDYLDAATALRLGLVNEVVPRAELDSHTLRLAQRIALQDPFALRLAKKACNAVLDIQGQSMHLEAAFETWALSALRPSVSERWTSDQSLPTAERIRKRDEKFGD